MGLFILSSGFADFFSSIFWGKLSDVSSKKSMIIGATIASGVGFLVYILDAFYENIFATIWIMPMIYFILTIGYQGIRIGRKTYLTDLAEGNRRTDYVAVSNTIIGIVLLFTGFIGSFHSLIGLSGIILLLSLFGVAGIILTSFLPEVTKED